MRKITALLLTFIMVLTFTGCSQQAGHNSNHKFDIASQDWTMTIIQSQNTDDAGLIIACGADSSEASDQAEEIDMVCSAEKGQLTLTDRTNGKIYSGTYSVKDSSAEATIYDITMGEAKGMAVVSDTKYHDGSQVGTLILSFEDYAISFSGKNK